ncbi:MAG: ribokinase [candidate division NC10 bacterium]|nr:ribokinase [candidate division NC10 bacterium]
MSAVVVVVGSANLDFTIQVDRAPTPGETILGRDLLVSFGGKGANQAVAALRAGAGVTFVGKVGKDQHGEQIRKNLESVGLDEAGLLSDATCNTGVAFILVEAAGANQIVVVPGCNYRLTPDELHSRDHLLSGTILLLQLETPLETVFYALQRGKQKGMRTILNPAPATPLPHEIFPLVDLLTPNETEASTLTGTTVGERSRAKEAGARLLEMGCGDVIITLGAQGSLWVGKDGARHFPGFSVPAVDSTAAGDAFNGALAAALAAGKAMEAAIPFANAAGALATTRRGAQASLPDRPAIFSLLSSMK